MTSDVSISGFHMVNSAYLNGSYGETLETELNQWSFTVSQLSSTIILLHIRKFFWVTCQFVSTFMQKISTKPGGKMANGPGRALEPCKMHGYDFEPRRHVHVLDLCDEEKKKSLLLKLLHKLRRKNMQSRARSLM